MERGGGGTKSEDGSLSGTGHSGASASEPAAMSQSSEVSLGAVSSERRMPKPKWIERLQNSRSSSSGAPGTPRSSRPRTLSSPVGTSTGTPSKLREESFAAASSGDFTALTAKPSSETTDRVGPQTVQENPHAFGYYGLPSRAEGGYSSWSDGEDDNDQGPYGTDHLTGIHEGKPPRNPTGLCSGTRPTGMYD